MDHQELDDWQPNRVSLEELLEIIKAAAPADAA